MKKRKTQLTYIARILKQKMIKLCVKEARNLCSKPRVHANMEAMLLVLVSCPFWCSRKCRVTVPWAASDSSVFPSEDNWTKTYHVKIFVYKENWTLAISLQYKPKRRSWGLMSQNLHLKKKKKKREVLSMLFPSSITKEVKEFEFWIYTLGKKIALNITIIIFASPDIATFAFYCVSHHVIDQAMLIPKTTIWSTYYLHWIVNRKSTQKENFN